MTTTNSLDVDDPATLVGKAPTGMIPMAESKRAVQAFIVTVQRLTAAWRPGNDPHAVFRHIMERAYGLALSAATRRDSIAPGDQVQETEPEPAISEARKDLGAIAERLRQDYDASPVETFEAFTGAYEELLELEPSIDSTSGKLRLHVPESHRRKTTGSYYTPAPLVEHLLDQTLQPLIDRALTKNNPKDAILSIRVCDPAAGTGRFLLRAARRLIRAVKAADANASEEAAHRVMARCIYGVDLDALALNLCRHLLALEAEVTVETIPELGHHIRPGNALLGTTPELFRNGIPDDAFKPREDDDPEVCRRLRTRNRRARTLPITLEPEHITQPQCDLWCASFLIEKTPDTESRGLCVTQDDFLPGGLLTEDLWESAGVASVAKIREEFQPFHWAVEFPEVMGSSSSEAPGFDVVIGNPPYLNQLESRTVHSRRVAALLRARFGDILRSYTDSSSLFLALAADLTRAGGRFGLILPQSILASRDARRLRHSLIEHSALRSLWVTDEYLFNASVFVCSPVFEKGGDRHSPIHIFRGSDFTRVDEHGGTLGDNPTLETWSHLAATAFGVPRVEAHAQHRIGDLAVVTADFRDEYYGLRGFVIDDPASRADESLFPRLITTGLIDLATCHWGTRPTRFNRQRWEAPRVDLQRLEREGDIGPWARRRLVPKILLATQTKVLELIVDEKGEWLPTTPIITIVPHVEDDLWHLAAALASPYLTAYALRCYGGTALTTDTIKLSAKQVARLPLPDRNEHWDRAASLFRTAFHNANPIERSTIILIAAEVMGPAFGLDKESREEIFDWWRARYLQSHQREE